MIPTPTSLRLVVAGLTVCALAAACSNGDDPGATTTTTEVSDVTVQTHEDGPPAASVTGSAMDLLREEPRFSSFLAAVEGTRYVEQLECPADVDDAASRGWATVLAPIDGRYEELAASGPEFSNDAGFGEANDDFRAAAGIAEGTEVTFDLDGGMGSMTWTSTQEDEPDTDMALPNGTHHVLFAVVDGRAVLPTDTGTPDLPSVATCGATSTLQFLVLGATLEEPEDGSADFPDIVPED